MYLSEVKWNSMCWQKQKKEENKWRKQNILQHRDKKRCIQNSLSFIKKKNPIALRLRSTGKKMAAEKRSLPAKYMVVFITKLKALVGLWYKCYCVSWVKVLLSVYCWEPATSPLYPLQGPPYILTLGEAPDHVANSMCYARPRTCLNYYSIDLGVEQNCWSAVWRQQNKWAVIVADQKNWFRPSIWGSPSTAKVKETWR